MAVASAATLSSFHLEKLTPLTLQRLPLSSRIYRTRARTAIFGGYAGHQIGPSDMEDATVTGGQAAALWAAFKVPSMRQGRRGFPISPL